MWQAELQVTVLTSFATLFDRGDLRAVAIKDKIYVLGGSSTDAKLFPSKLVTGKSNPRDCGVGRSRMGVVWGGCW